MRRLKTAEREREASMVKGIEGWGTDGSDSKVRERNEEADFNGHVGRLS